MKPLAHTYCDPLYLQISQAIAAGLEELGSAPALEEVQKDLTDPPNWEMGHMAYPCFKLAKALRKSPAQIAEELSEKLNGHELFESCKAAGPYANLYLSAKTLGSFLIPAAMSDKLFQIPPMDMQPVMVEYSQPNTHKELHVGHMRNLCYGNALVRLLRYSGRPTLTATFPGDVGTHVAKCLWFLKYHNKDDVPLHGRGEWLGGIYTKAHNKLEEEKGSVKEAHNREQLTAILKQLEQKEGEFFELWQETRQWSIELMNSVYKWADVEFENWYWESDVDSPSVEWVKELYQQGKLEKSEGAIGYDLNDEKLGFCLLLKSDGNGLYATKDLSLAKKKFEDHNPSLSLYVVDQRQELHFKQVFSVLKKIGYEQAERCMHLKYNFVELPDGAMSSRKGNIVPISQLIKNMKNHVKDNYLNRYQGQWSESDIDMTADMVAQGAIKYGMNAMDTNKKIVFDMAEWLKLDGESGPYIQYTHARICSLLEKSGLALSADQAADYEKLDIKAELQLMVKLSQFNKVAESCAMNFRTSNLCSYLYELSKLFNSFYHDCPINSLEDEDLKLARTQLAKVTALTIKEGLSLLGIPAPERM